MVTIHNPAAGVCSVSAAAAVRGIGPMEARHRAAAADGGLTGHRSNAHWELELPTNLLEVFTVLVEGPY